MKPRQKRFFFIALAIVAVLIAGGLIIKALRSNIAYAFSPSQVVKGEVAPGELFRLAGMVKKGSLKRLDNGLTVSFVVTDTVKEVTVQHTGILPDLFKEGQGTVAKGRLNDQGIFVADEVLAKHDESYMPPEAADAVKAAQTVKE